MKGGLSAALVLLGLFLLTPAQATIGTIQPGDQSVSGGAGCTLNFVFDGTGDDAGRVFMGSAAHCVVEVGDVVDSWPYDGFGTVAAMGSAGSARADWALIEVKPEFHRYVRAEVKGHPGFPTKVAMPADTMIGDPVQISGYGMLFGSSAPTQERRLAVLTGHDSDEHAIVGPIIYGDSGGPLVHIPSGGALGLNSRLCVVGPCTEIGPTIQGLIAQAKQQGLDVALRTIG